MRTYTRPDTNREAGAILPIVAILIIVLLVFAAFTVDLGAAWAERRQDQTAADAGAMAGALEYIVGSPSEADVVDVVRDYVEKNIGLPAGSVDWYTCPTPPTEFAALVDSSGSAVNCISLKQADTSSNDTLFRVKIPDRAVPTSFARLIGIETIDVSAIAISQIIPPGGLRGALPFFLPSDPGIEYCLGTPPSGLARELCDGPSDGNFGSMDSPYFGTDDDPWGTTSCLDSPANNNERIVWNSALGIDHFLRAVDPAANLSPAAGADVCSAASHPGGYIPYAIVGDQGSLAQASDGFIGSGPYGSLGFPGRLRQSNGLPGGVEDWRSVPEGKGAIPIDNVPLWDYLSDIFDSGDACHSDNFNSDTYSGTELTDNLLDCLAEERSRDPRRPIFRDALIGAPRFALAPQIDATQEEIGDLGPNSKSAINITNFLPVYLQASWYNCSATECMYFATSAATSPPPTSSTSSTTSTTAPLPPAPDIYHQVFEPGEGTTQGCLDADDCPPKKWNVNLVMNGITSLVLEDEWFSVIVRNDWGEFGEASVRLYE